jgi:aspartyl-tRNA synthetase
LFFTYKDPSIKPNPLKGISMTTLEKLERSSLCGQLSSKNVGSTQTLLGWTATIRNHGGVIFIDLRDHTGIIQLVLDPSNKELLALGDQLRSEFVIGVTGTVNKRADNAINKNIPTGEVEVLVDKLVILNKCAPLPFPIGDENTAEELRLTYRYLDLRNDKMQKNIRLRHELIFAIRSYMDQNGFCEIETPTLSKSTPEGARDFIVPARTNPGQFFALPQSPQIYKQLLIASGMDKYFQIARCYRDEDLRANRQPEFTQLDIELAYATEEKIYALLEGLMANLWKKFFNKTLPIPLTRYSFDEVFAKYGSDKPDMRFETFVYDVSSLFAGTELTFIKTALAQKGHVGALCLKGQDLSRSDLEYWVTKTTKELGGKGLLYIKFDENKAIQSPVSKFLSPDFFDQAAKIIPGLTTKDTLFVVAGNYEPSWNTLGKLRVELGKHFNLIDTKNDAIFWVTDFPLLEWDEDEKRWNARHHPFTSPQKGADFSNPGIILARAYDMVCNGEELGGGSIRIHTPEMQSVMFELLGISKERAENNFGFLLKAQQLGFPPHGGIALGIDRLTMMFAGTDSIRDVIAFPKTQSMRCLMMDSPTTLEEKQLKELYIKTIPAKP